MGDEKKKNAGRKVRNLTAAECKSILGKIGGDQSLYRQHVMGRAKKLGVHA